MGIRSQNNPLAAYLDVFSRSGTDAATAAPAGGGLTATGGVISDYTSGSDVYRAHIFTSSGTFDVTAPGSFGDTVEYLVVGGGGGGGGASSAGGGRGGGGAGGLRTNLPGVVDAGANPLTISTPFAVSTTGGNGSGSYTVTIGGGATGNNASGDQGVDSYFGPPSTPDGITATGGGAGGYNPEFSPATENDGGSGGGTYNPGVPNIGLGNTPPTSPPQGNNSGQGSGNTASGGGGAGAVGPNAPSSVGGAGGAGVQVAIAGPGSRHHGCWRIKSRTRTISVVCWWWRRWRFLERKLQVPLVLVELEVVVMVKEMEIMQMVMMD